MGGLACATAAGAVVVVRARSRAAMAVAALLLAVSCVCWLKWNKPFEGRILVTLTARHGVTIGDLAVVPAVVVGAGLLVRLVRVSGRP